MKIHTLNDEVIEFDDSMISRLIQSFGYSKYYYDSDATVDGMVRSLTNDWIDNQILSLEMIGGKYVPIIFDKVLNVLPYPKYDYIKDMISPICGYSKNTQEIYHVLNKLKFKDIRVDMNLVENILNLGVVDKESLITLSSSLQDLNDYRLFKMPYGLSAGVPGVSVPILPPRSIRRLSKRIGKRMDGFKISLIGPDNTTVLDSVTKDSIDLRSFSLSSYTQYVDGSFTPIKSNYPNRTTVSSFRIPNRFKVLATDTLSLRIEPYYSGYYFGEDLYNTNAALSVYMNSNNETNAINNVFDIQFNGTPSTPDREVDTYYWHSLDIIKVKNRFTRGSISYKRKNPMVNYKCEIYDLYTGQKLPITNDKGVNLDGPDVFTIGPNINKQIKAYYQRINKPTNEFETTIDDLVTNTDLLIVFREKK